MKLQPHLITLSDWREILLQTNVFRIHDCKNITYSNFVEWWSSCKNGGQLLKLAAQDDSITKQQLVFTVCQVVRTVLHFIPKGEDRPRIAIETAEAWCFGKATLDEVKAAADATATHAAVAAVAAYYAADAAYYAADAAYYAAHAAHAAHAAYYAAYYAANTAYYAAHAAHAAQAKLSDIVRQYLPIPTQLDHDMKQLLKLKAFW